MAKRRRSKPVPKTLVHGNDRYELQVFRIVECDDGVTRLEVIPDDGSIHRLHDDIDRNHFVTGYLHESASEYL